MTMGKWSAYVIAAAAANYAVKAAPGVFHGFTVVTAGAADSTAKIYNGLDATGVLIATYTGLAIGDYLIGADIDMTAGIFIVTTAGAGAAPAMVAFYI
ncbi:MAG: hypothetical protein Q7N50_05680 [Armatimonadota bacterium]|nr:hypothetical protein [Armatimonadota bacterium]